MKRLLFISCSLFSLTAFSQQVFFTSPNSYKEKELKGFYASVTQQDNLLLFNAPDYKIYAFDKTTGAEKWNYNTRWRSNIAPFIVDDQVWVKTDEGTILLHKENGQKIKDLAFESVYTQPIRKDSLLYFTGIYDLGAVFAYNPKNDSIHWQRFLAHGCMESPYYQKDKIVANAEGTRWIELTYDGQLLDASCDTDSIRFPSELPCAKEFSALTHDGKPITGKLAKDLDLEDYTLPEVLTTSKNTFVLGHNNEQLTVFNNKLKKKVQVELFNVSDALSEFNTDSLAYPNHSLTKILKADDTHVWIAYYHHLLIYNHSKKALDRVVDLSAWEPHQIVTDNNNLWIISKKDGRLYGVRI